jgi:hypothetical protein
MTTFSISVDIGAPPARVWAVMKDVERWPEWTATVTSIRKLDPGPLAVGTRAAIRQPRLPPARWQVIAVEEGRGFTWVTRSPGVVITAKHAVEPMPSGSRATLSLEFGGLFGAVVAWLTAGVNRRYLGIESAGLKRRSEAP